jgi:hypothetical protein
VGKDPCRFKRKSSQNLLGEPGRKQEVGTSMIWWYRYTNGEKRCIGFQEGMVLEWKRILSEN